MMDAPEPPSDATAPRPGRSRPWIGTVLGLAFTLTACAPLLPSQPEGYSAAYANDVIEAGFSYISDRYIEPVGPRELALSALPGLAELDDSFTLTDNGATMVAQIRSVETVLRVPSGDSSADWARFSTRVIDAAREHSPVIQGTDPEALFEVLFDTALHSLDGFSRYAGADDASDARAMREGFGGIGLTVRMEEQDAAVLSVVEGAPAARAGVLPEDRITHVDGVLISGWTQRELIRTLRGRVGTDVELTLHRMAPDSSYEVELRRQQIVPPTVVVNRRGNVAVVKVTSFNQRTARTVAQKVTELRRRAPDEVSGIILDLRDNPGGLLDQAIEVADVFLNGGEIAATRGRHPHSEQSYKASGADLSGGMPLVVLVNGNSASASEVVAAALQDLGRGILIGTNSYGKGTVQTVYRLPNDGELTLTWSRLHAPSGYRLHGLGVLPSVCSHGGGNTSGISDLIAGLRSGVAPARNLFHDWRTVSPADEDVVTDLRHACEADNGAPATDIDVAEMLLSDRALYTRVLESGNQAIARRP